MNGPFIRNHLVASSCLKIHTDCSMLTSGYIVTLVLAIGKYCQILLWFGVFVEAGLHIFSGNAFVEHYQLFVCFEEVKRRLV